MGRMSELHITIEETICRITYSFNDAEKDIPKKFSKFTPLAGALVEVMKSDRHLYILTEAVSPSSGIVP